ncbi:MAG: hypothetical protein JNL81_03135 [Hyphomonadaceae bacterium]|nr:hypothetical protein [Hyphomonadaceae bacterium]
MASDRSREKLIEFIEYLGNKGLLASATAGARKAAVGKVFGILSEEEASDVFAVDLDVLMTRFSNLQGKNYTPESMTTYKSRVRSSLDEFAEYLKNPLGYKPGVQSRDRRPKPSKENENGSPAKPTPKASPAADSPTTAGISNILPIQLRADLTVRIQGIPFDLTEAEARRIANVILAMANPS